MQKTLSTEIIIAMAFFSLAFIRTGLALNVTIDVDTTWGDAIYTYDDVLVTDSATLLFDGSVTLNCNNLTIDAGASISAYGRGYGPQSGPGGSVADGGGYGGEGGGTYGGPTYGSAMTPTDLGSGGGALDGGSGGGAIRLDVGGTLIVDGAIKANGQTGYSNGGGSGGSVYIVTTNLAGSGIISANGGNSIYKGGGGRGVDKFRIKIWDKDNNDEVTYDNQLGDADDADAIDAIEGGSIVIHSGS